MIKAKKKKPKPHTHNNNKKQEQSCCDLSNPVSLSKLLHLPQLGWDGWEWEELRGLASTISKSVLKRLRVT